MTYTATTAAINLLRKEMNLACRGGLLALTKSLFAENPTVNSIYWTQTFDQTGVSLGTIKYTEVKVINGRAASPQHLLAAEGPSPLVQFAAFLRSIGYHLCCAHGLNVTVVITADTVTATPA
jgi:hypothetical protein